MAIPPKPQHNSRGVMAGCVTGLLLAAVAITVGFRSDPRGFLLVVPAVALVFLSGFVGNRRERMHREATQLWRRAIAPPAGDSWKHQFEAEGLSDLIRKTEPHIRLGVRLEKKPFDGKLGSSRLGGFPDLPIDTDWPGRFLVQVNLAEVADVFPDSPLPKSGHLWFLLEDDENARIYYASAETLLVPPQGMVQTALGIRFVAFEDIPHRDDAPEAYFDIQEYLGENKLLGYCNWLQDVPEDAASKVLLLQLAMDKSIGFDAGELGCFLIDEQDLKQGRFETATFVPQWT